MSTRKNIVGNRICKTRARKKMTQDQLSGKLAFITVLAAFSLIFTLVADAADVERFKITRLEIKGDADLLDMLHLKAAIEADSVGKSLSRKDILDIAGRYQQQCVQAGYYLTLIKTPPTDYSKGILVYEIDKGRVGKIALYDRTPGERYREKKNPFPARQFSEAQIRRRLKRLKDGDIFDYNEFYRSVFSVNSHPDLMLDTDLRIRKEFIEGRQRRYADMDFYIKESFPLHAVLEFANTGTEPTDEWRASLMVQHLNITRHDDILTLNTFSSVDFKSMLSFAASYYVPHYFWNGGSFTIYGGYSEVEAGDIVPFVDLLGTGWFVGLQASYKPTTSEKHLLSISAGGLCRFIQHSLLLDPCEDSDPASATPPSDVMIIPVSVTVNYSSGKPDRWGGRNFFTSRTSFNLGRFLGGSDDEEIAGQRETARANYFVERLRLARIQPLFGRDAGQSEKRRQWTLFTKVEGQFSNTPLIPAEQKSVGGMNTVRGYPERVALGDNGVSGTVELRTPIFPGLLARLAGSGRDRDPEAVSGDIDHLQFVAFVGGASVSVKEAAEEESSYSLVGAGAGLRLALREHMQFKFDWGFPLKETTGSDSGGRGHLSLQMQF